MIYRILASPKRWYGADTPQMFIKAVKLAVYLLALFAVSMLMCVFFTLNRMTHFARSVISRRG